MIDVKNKLLIVFGGEENSSENLPGVAQVKYTLWTAFDEEPVLVGQATKEVYSLTGTILWDKVLAYVLSVLNIYKDHPKLGTGFIDEIALNVELSDYGDSEGKLLIEFSKSKDMLNKEISSYLREIDLICKKYNFKGSINKIPLERFMSF